MPTAPFNQPPKFHEAAYRAAISTLKLKKKPLGEGPAIVRHLKKETGLGSEVMQLVRKSHPGDPLRQIEEFFDHFYIPAATGRKRVASGQTDRAYRVRLATAVKKLTAMNFAVKNLEEISAKQIKLMFLAFEKEGWSASWMANVNTTVRRFGIWIGKPDLCPRLPLLLENPSAAQRRHAPTEPKDWESKQIDIEMYLAQIELVSPVTALQLRLAKAFGVRVQEFLMFRPDKAQRGDCLYVQDGTKGGRPRLVPIETDEQRAVMEQAREIAKDHPLGLIVAKKGLTLTQATNHFYNTVRKAGITRKSLGVTTHGLRHGYACEIYKRMTGVDAPVLGGKYVDPAVDKAARMDIAERLGHSRTVITNAYLGSHLNFSRVKKENMDILITVLEQDPVIQAMAEQAGLSQVCVLGSVADGEPVSKVGTLVLGYHAIAQTNQTQGQADAVALSIVAQMASRAGTLLGVVGTAVSMMGVSNEVSTFELIGLGLLSGNKGRKTGELVQGEMA
ncbi:MAG: site-specific integrase [Rhodoferax sp.]|nr:site-specific integrase [Rhodoferax sp.]